MSSTYLKFSLCSIGAALSALCFSAQAQKQAQETDPTIHEAPVWSGSYRGTLAGKAVQLELWRLD
ncbi:MAG: hypothetical protein RR855_20580, partial [Comamonas sp.]